MPPDMRHAGLSKFLKAVWAKNRDKKSRVRALSYKDVLNQEKSIDDILFEWYTQ